MINVHRVICVFFFTFRKNIYLPNFWLSFLCGNTKYKFKTIVKLMTLAMVAIVHCTDKHTRAHRNLSVYQFNLS